MSRRDRPTNPEGDVGATRRQQAVHARSGNDLDRRAQRAAGGRTSSRRAIVTTTRSDSAPSEDGHRRSRWPDPTVTAAAIAAVASCIVTIIGGIIASSNQPRVSCTQVVEEYRRLIVDGHVPHNVLTEPGQDGKSVLLSDDNAHRCGLDSATLEKLAR